MKKDDRENITQFLHIYIQFKLVTLALTVEDSDTARVLEKTLVISNCVSLQNNLQNVSVLQGVLTMKKSEC